MTDSERNAVISECIKAAVAEINRAREEGETDLRSVRVWVESALGELKAVTPQ